MSSPDAGRGTIDWHGRQFPHTTLDGDVLPEAFLHEDGLLPHLHENLEEIFPRAWVCRGQGDEDPPEDTGLEEFGTALGQLPEAEKKDTMSVETLESTSSTRVVSTTIHGLKE